MMSRPRGEGGGGGPIYSSLLLVHLQGAFLLKKRTLQNRVSIQKHFLFIYFINLKYTKYISLAVAVVAVRVGGGA